MSAHKRAKALELIHAYEDVLPNIWPHVDPERLAEQLEERVKDPDLIAQQQSSWCGPAAFLRSFARDDPTAYAHLIIDLARQGKAYFKGGPHSAVCLHPHPDIVACNFDKTSIEDADWIGLASLRDNLRNPKSPLRGLFHKGTYPDDIMKFYAEFGYQDVSDWTSEQTLGAESAHGANHYLKHHYRVTLRIHDNMLYEERKKTPGGRHDHWVDLIGHFHWQGDPSHKDTLITLKVFSWGREIDIGGLTAQQCFHNYYGFVCAKY